MKGWIYVITNKAMPNLVKIGYTDRDPDVRALELGGTGNPYPYEIQYCALVNQARAKEQRLHQIFSSNNAGKEWFSVDPETVVAKIIAEFGNDILHEDRRIVSAADIQKAAALEQNKKLDRDRAEEQRKNRIRQDEIGRHNREIASIDAEIRSVEKSMVDSPEELKELRLNIFYASIICSFFGFIFVGDLLAGIILGVIAAFIILGLFSNFEDGVANHKLEKLKKKKEQLKNSFR